MPTPASIILDKAILPTHLSSKEMREQIAVLRSPLYAGWVFAVEGCCDYAARLTRASL